MINEVNEEILKELKVQTELLQHIAIQSTIAAHCAYLKLTRVQKLEVARAVKQTFPEE